MRTSTFWEQVWRDRSCKHSLVSRKWRFGRMTDLVVNSARKQIDIAKKEGCIAVSHGCTGKLLSLQKKDSHAQMDETDETDAENDRSQGRATIRCDSSSLSVSQRWKSYSVRRVTHVIPDALQPSIKGIRATRSSEKAKR